MINGKKGKIMFIMLCIVVFIIAFIGSAIFKLVYTPKWAREYEVELTPEIGTKVTDLEYGEGDANKFDLYLPADDSKDSYNLVVYLHAGGFTSGDKSGDEQMLSWLTSKGYVAAGINYTLRTEINETSVLTQSIEIKEAVPYVVEAAKEYGYNIENMAISGGSAGGTLAMLYAYRDSDTSPVPVKLLFESVGPANFYAEDWTSYGLDKDHEAAASLFGIMAGVDIDPNVVGTDDMQELVKPISASSWINGNSVPTVVAYGKYDKICPYESAKRLRDILNTNKVDYQFFEAEHSGHGLQNDNKVYSDYLSTVEEYLNKYLPVQ